MVPNHQIFAKRKELNSWQSHPPAHPGLDFHCNYSVHLLKSSCCANVPSFGFSSLPRPMPGGTGVFLPPAAPEPLEDVLPAPPAPPPPPLLFATCSRKRLIACSLARQLLGNSLSVSLTFHDWQKTLALSAIMRTNWPSWPVLMNFGSAAGEMCGKPSFTSTWTR